MQIIMQEVIHTRANKCVCPYHRIVVQSPYRLIALSPRHQIAVWSLNALAMLPDMRSKNTSLHDDNINGVSN